MLVFRIINVLVDISASVAGNAFQGYVLGPLASSTTLWEARDAEIWNTEFRQFYKERALYAVSEAGVLTRFQHHDAGIQSSVAEWEEWNAEVGDLGTLVMVVGALLT